MGQKRLGIDPELVQMCEQAEVDYEIVRKRRHVVLRIDGRQVLVMPDRLASLSDGRARDNARCCLRRFLRSRQPCHA